MHLHPYYGGVCIFAQANQLRNDVIPYDFGHAGLAVWHLRLHDRANGLNDEFAESPMPTIEMTVNGEKVSGTVEHRTLLSEFLRETLKLTGTP